MKKLESVLNMILKILFIDGFDYSFWPEHEEESTDKKESEDLLPMPLLEGDEEVTEGRGSKFLTPKIINYTFNIISTNKNWKQFIQIKTKIRKILSLLYHHNKITKKVYKNVIKSLKT